MRKKLLTLYSIAHIIVIDDCAIAQIGGQQMGELNIKKVMRDKSISIEAVSAVLSIHRNSAANKVNGISAFRVDEAFKLRDTLFPEYNIDYLFSPANQDSNLKGA